MQHQIHLATPALEITTCLFLSSPDLCFGRSSHFLRPVLLLFALFTRLLLLLEETESCESILGFVLFQVVQTVVYESKSRCLPSTERRLETKTNHTISRTLVHTSKLLSYITLGNGCLPRMKNVDHHL